MIESKKSSGPGECESAADYHRGIRPAPAASGCRIRPTKSVD